MDIQEYIASGVLELYATGLLTPTEKAEVEHMAELYPEVKAELDAISDTLDTYAKLHAVEPPADLKDKVLGKITPAFTSSAMGQSSAGPEFKQIAFSPEPALVVASEDSHYSWWAVAASVLLLISAGLNFYFYNNWQSTKNQYQLALAAQNQYAQQVQQVNQKLQIASNELAIITDDQTQKINLKGLPKSPSSLVVVYWNRNTKNVYLKVAKLPTPPADRQYQLWALENGKPIDAGMLNNLPDSTNVQHMKAINQAQAFAITLEPKGGSINPTTNEMYVMGQI